MTIWTKNFKIRHLIIVAVSILMMNSKYSRFFSISTTIALINQCAGNHSFSYCCKRWLKSFFGRFINAGSRTIFSIVTSMAYKFFQTINTGKFSFTFIPLRNVITRSRTIFSFIASAGNMFKFFVAYMAISCMYNPCSKSRTFSTTIFRQIFSIMGSRVRASTLLAFKMLPSMNSLFLRSIHYAAT